MVRKYCDLNNIVLDEKFSWLTNKQTQNKQQALAAGILTSIAAGIGKEIYDSLQKKNHFDQHDVAATVLGGVSFSLVIKLDAINFGSEAKRKKKKRKKQKNEK